MICISKQVRVHKYLFFHFYKFAKSIIALEFVQLYGRNANFRLKCWKQMLQNRFAILGRSYIQCCTLQTFLNVRVKLIVYLYFACTYFYYFIIYLSTSKGLVVLWEGLLINSVVISVEDVFRHRLLLALPLSQRCVLIKISSTQM